MRLTLLFLSFVLFSGCVIAEPVVVVPSKPSVVSTKEAVYPSGTVFYKTDDGKDVPIAVGTTIVIKLNEDPHGKFIWGILENNKSIFEVVKNTSQVENAPGGKGVAVRTFTMKATKLGKSNLKIVYFMAGDQDIAGKTYLESYRLNVKILNQ